MTRNIIFSFICILCVLSTSTVYSQIRLLGDIGTVTRDEQNLIPSGSTAQLFFNIRDEAEDSGFVSSLRYCYTIPFDVEANIYQATVGFYRRRVDRVSREADIFQLISDSFNITVDADNTTTLDRTVFQCAEMDIPSVQVQEDDLIGVCSRDYPEDSIGRLGLTSRSSDISLRNEVQVQNILCSRAGCIPESVSRSDLDQISLRLQIFGNITDAPVTAATMEIKTTQFQAIFEQNVTPEATDNGAIIDLTLVLPAGLTGLFSVITCTAILVLIVFLLCRQRREKHQKVDTNLELEDNLAYRGYREDDTTQNAAYIRHGEAAMREVYGRVEMSENVGYDSVGYDDSYDSIISAAEINEENGAEINAENGVQTSEAYDYITVL